MDNNIFYSDAPYPEIVGAIKNPEVVSKLYSLYAGPDSELNAILQYSYQQFVLSGQYPEISKILEEISIVEMRHLELLGEAILAFGGLPYFVDGQGNQYSASSVFYCTRPKEMLKRDLNDELNAGKTYRKIANQVHNQSLSDLLMRIALDEDVHAQKLQHELNILDHNNNNDYNNNYNNSNNNYYNETNESNQNANSILFDGDRNWNMYDNERSNNYQTLDDNDFNFMNGNGEKNYNERNNNFDERNNNFNEQNGNYNFTNTPQNQLEPNENYNAPTDAEFNNSPFYDANSKSYPDNYGGDQTTN